MTSGVRCIAVVAAAFLMATCGGKGGDQDGKLVKPTPRARSSGADTGAGVVASAPELVTRFDFENELSSDWRTRGQNVEIGVDRAEPHGGARSLRMVKSGPGNSAVASRSLSAEPFRGKRIELSGYVKTRDVSQGWAALSRLVRTCARAWVART